MTSVGPGARIVVTGASGFVGQALVEHLATSGYQVVGVSKDTVPPVRIRDLLTSYHCADLTLGWPEIGPYDGLVHLAGLAAVGPSFRNPQLYLNVNGSMVTHMFESAVRRGWKGRAIVVSSGAVYESTSYANKLTEASPVAASSPYVVSKLLLEKQVEYYCRLGLDIVITRPFNHIGPGQRTGFIVPDLVTKMINRRSDNVITAGNLNTARDYTDVRDVVSAYALLLECSQLSHNLYNVCTGIPVRGWDILEKICCALDLQIPTVGSASDRTLDPLIICGDAEALHSATGWRPEIPLSRSIGDSLSEMVGMPNRLAE